MTLLIAALYGLGAVIGILLALLGVWYGLKVVFWLGDKLYESDHRDKILIGTMVVFLWLFWTVIIYTELS